MENVIKIKGARVHNLKNISLEIPKNKLTVFTGVSGSGKSSLAFDTIFAEGQRRYIESLSPYARQFLGQMERADVDEITGLSPAIAINQKALSHNPRSTVGTLTEIYDYLRVLYARLGEVFCPTCDTKIEKLTPDEMVDIIMGMGSGLSPLPRGTEGGLPSIAAPRQRAANHPLPLLGKEGMPATTPTVTILAPVVRGRKGEYYQMLYDMLNEGFDQARIDGKMFSLHDQIELSRYKAHNIDIVMDRVMLSDETRLFEAVENALNHSKGLVTIIFGEGRENETERLLSSQWSCPKDNFSFPEIEPRLFSFNSPAGACPTCGGLGKTDLFLKIICPDCQGKRLKPEALSVRIKEKNIYEVSALTIAEGHEFFKNYEKNLNERHRLIAHNVVKEINDRLKFLLEVGLDYITLIREAETLSGGEAQRIRLASQIGSHLSNTLYVLDEPTIGLHERDTERLVKTLKSLRDSSNTVLIVEHDERTIKESDYLIDLGPMAGEHGGEVVFAGPSPSATPPAPPLGKGGILATVARDSALSPSAREGVGGVGVEKSLTVQYLTGEKKIEVPQKRRWKETEEIIIVGARANNLKNINVNIPLRKFVCISGVSGSGKSTLLYDVLYENVNRLKNRLKKLDNVNRISNTEYVDKVIIADQSPIGRTPRSNPATYTGIFTPIRDFFASLEESRVRGYTHSRFSFNVPGGRCEACQGAGFNLIEMHFMPAVEVPCEVCHGKRFSRETLQVKYKGKNISEVLEMTVDQAARFFENIYLITDKLKVLKEVGLGYLRLGQSATTLSGGEAQRIKLARELTGPLGKKTLYLLDEPTVGLHYHDIEMLLTVINKLVDKGNSVVVIEHNLHILKSADYIIDMGPEGGEKGGKIVAKGTPEEVGDNPNSYTGLYLKEYLD